MFVSWGERPVRVRISKVHGHDMSELGRLVNKAWRGSDSLTLDSAPHGGWDSVSLIARTPRQRYILKLPVLKGPHKAHPYSYEYEVMNFLRRRDLCPKPIQCDRLDDEFRTPFIIAEYAEGTIPSSLDQIPASGLEKMRQALLILSQLHPRGVQSYKKPSEYLKHITDQVLRSKKGSTGFSPQLAAAAGFFGVTAKELGSSIDAACVWSRRTMHGDLQESNIIIQPDRVLLLDLGSCSIGEPLLDLAYLVSQAEGATHHHVPDGVFKSYEEAAIIQALVPLALMSAIGWSICFLANLEREMIEPEVVTPDIGPRVLGYIHEKIDYLRSILVTRQA